MMSVEQKKRTAPLEIYLAYEFLPASQLARILSAIDSLYNTIAHDAMLNDPTFANFAPFLYSPIRNTSAVGWRPWLPLCLDTIETGNSIKFSFAADRRAAGLHWKDGDLDVILPRSTAPLVAIGALLVGGGWGIDQYWQSELVLAQVAKTQAETVAIDHQNNLTDAQADLVRAQAAEILSRNRLNAPIFHGQGNQYITRSARRCTVLWAS